MTTKQRTLLDKFIRFASVGAFGVVVQYLVLILLVEVFDLNTVLASGCGFVIAAWVNYYLNYHYTFASEKCHRETFVKFSIIAGIGLLLNSAIIAAATGMLSLHYLLAQALAIGVVLIWNFSGNLLWTFKEHKPA
jgi:putative flippase GtrA